MSPESNPLFLTHTLTRVDDIQAALFELGHADSLITVRNAAGQEIAVEILALDKTARCFYWRPRDFLGADFASTNPHSALTGLSFEFQAQGYGGVQIQFQVGKPQIVRSDQGWPALISHFPTQLVRIQRRGAFRVQVANARVLASAVWQAEPGAKPLHFQVRDLSIDGVGMRSTHPVSLLPAPGSCMQNIALDFGKHGDMLVDLDVRNLYPMGRQNEEADKNPLEESLSHLGGRFIGLDARQTSRLQKIVWAMEKSRIQPRA